MVGPGQAPAASAGTADGVDLGSVDGLLAAYSRYLLVERKLEPVTVSGYASRLRPFLVGTAVPGLDLGGLTSADVYAFLLTDGRRRTRRSAKTTVTALRSLLRFLHGRGVIGEALAEGVPSVAQWRLTGVPQHLEPDQVQALFDACDRETVTGVRAFAVLKLMARLGLRRCEVARLMLDDIDWRAGEIVIRGKRSRRDRLPLPPDAGEALADYLQRGRPAEVAYRHVFMTRRPPYRPMACLTINEIVARCGKRAGLGRIGTHRLRHTAATMMLAQGVPLAQIGQVLRHRSPANTAIYAKVHREALRSIARPWPGALS